MSHGVAGRQSICIIIPQAVHMSCSSTKEEVLVTTHNEHSGRHMKDLYGVGGEAGGGAHAEGVLGLWGLRARVLCMGAHVLRCA